jgi:(2R)-sulfolactate sulfo-lyase subunit alpha
LADRMTRGDCFDELLAAAKQHVYEEGEFQLRALLDLETDGVDLFDANKPADAAFVAALNDYLAARLGANAASPLLFVIGADGIAIGTNPPVTQISTRSTGGEFVQHKFLIHRRGDHVGVAVADIDRGERVLGFFLDDDSMVEVDALDSVPLGHKIAIVASVRGEHVLEYGLVIGKATEEIRVGAYVHTHNLRSDRW